MEQELRAKCSCTRCGTHLDFSIEAAGRVIDCPHCGAATELSLESNPASGAGTCSTTELLAAFTGPIARRRVSLLYQLGLVLVTVMMLLLPVVYLGLIAVEAWGVYWFSTHCFFLLRSSFGGVWFYLTKSMVYVSVVFSGVVLLFFMIKPLFARRAPRAQPLAMNPALEPTLYAFIARICELTGAPMPARIDLDCQLNAAAGFRRGASSLFGNDLVLVIGLPLVAGLNLREFAGVVTHEFGHFTQGFGMRLSYVIRHINGWFARVVYERDAWDLQLEEWSMEAQDWRVILVVGCARLAVGCSRLVLMMLMFLGHGVSCFLLRQMEYDADSYEIRLVGSDTFETTVRRLAVLGEAAGKAYKQMRMTWNLSRKLPDNFPLYLTYQAAALPPALCQKIQDTLGLSQTGLFHTHPSDGDRIRRARQAGEPGVFHLELPAAVLFSHFDIVAKQVTCLHYCDDLGLEVDGSVFRPVEPIRSVTD